MKLHKFQIEILDNVQFLEFMKSQRSKLSKKTLKKWREFIEKEQGK